ncbi:MAG TPA: hypothetical protein ENH91_07070 [Leeuwenhoekiella sp.]|nr:hypothetical protein [Leeuwenhoekiella sp.]
MESNKHIEAWLEAYFEGESTLEQEQKLRAYFTGDTVAPYLEKYIPLFAAFAEAKQERYTGEINLPVSRKKYPWLSIAASILVIVGLFLFFNNRNDNADNRNDYGTYKDPQVAALKTKQALFMMGSFIDQSTSRLNALDEFEKTTDKYINKQ